MSGQAKILKYFHFPFSILHLSFVIAGIVWGDAMANGKRNMENGK